jgi:hypothetical protein
MKGYEERLQRKATKKADGRVYLKADGKREKADLRAASREHAF